MFNLDAHQQPRDDNLVNFSEAVPKFGERYGSDRVYEGFEHWQCHSASTASSISMIRVSIFLAVVSLAFGQEQLFSVPVSTDGKSHNAPLPTLLEMPYQKTSLPNLGPAAVSEVTSSSVSVPSPFIDVPKRFESVVDIPHAPIPMPQGGHEVENVDYKIQQPVIEVPKPIFQKKKVFFNVPQPIVQIPEPVIRHRPILYTVPHIVRLHKPTVTHEKIFYQVPQAQIRPKSGYGQQYN